MKAPKELPTLPGMGGDGTLYVRFDPPSLFLELETYREPEGKQDYP